MRKNVLVVDDSSTMRYLLRKTILMGGVPVGQFFEASNGREGLTVLDAQQIDLILTDLNMPVMGGLEMIREIRANPKWANLPIIVVSTEFNQTRIDQIKASGVHFIRKPFKSKTIQEVVKQFWALYSPVINNKIVCQVAQEVLESMAIQSEYVRDPQFPVPFIRGELEFSGTLQGILILDTHAEVLGEWAGGVLGLSQAAITREQCEDVLREMVNMLCGHLLCRVVKKKQMIDMTIPRVLHDQSAEPGMDDGIVIQLYLNVPRGCMRLALCVHKAAESEMSTG